MHLSDICHLQPFFLFLELSGTYFRTFVSGLSWRPKIYRSKDLREGAFSICQVETLNKFFMFLGNDIKVFSEWCPPDAHWEEITWWSQQGSKQVKYQLSRDEICVANFIPPAIGASLGSYLVKNALAPWRANFFWT